MWQYHHPPPIWILEQNWWSNIRFSLLSIFPRLPSSIILLMGSLRLSFSQTGLHQNFKISTSKLPAPSITCGLRKVGPRKPMWRSRVLSPEAIQAVQSLKSAKSPEKLAEVFESGISRLLKADLLDTLSELQRQNELELALQVFNFARKEVWYEPDISLFSNMIQMLGKNSMIQMAEKLFFELEKEGLRPDTRTYTEIIGAYFRVKMINKGMEMYESMKASGCAPDKLTFMILIKNLEKAGEKELVSTVKKDCVDYIEFPKDFLQEVERKYPKRRSLNLV